MLKYIFFLFVVLLADSVIAQVNESVLIKNGPKGNYILVANHPGAIIERSKAGSDNFKKIGTMSVASSWQAFQEIAGTEVATAYKQFSRSGSNEEVIRKLHSGNAKDFGFFVLNIQFLRATGAAFLDEVNGQNAFDYKYRIRAVSGNILFEGVPQRFNKINFPKPVVDRIQTTDSIVKIRWKLNGGKRSLPLFAKIYRQADGSGPFVPYPKLLTVTLEENNSYVYFQEKSLPERMSNYYIIPVDMFGNEGFLSDTASAVTIDFKKVGGLNNIRITDSSGGLFCRWEPLADKPYYTGIQVLRSRNAMKDFIVLDTLAANATGYFDKRVLPNTTYFYKFRVLVYKLSGWQEIIASTVHGTTKSSGIAPLPPNNFDAVNFGENVKLTWSRNSEPDVFACYVYRGTSADNMEIISPAVFDTVWIDSTKSLSGRTSYVYAVAAMNNSQLMSGLSNKAGTKPMRSAFVEAPPGISVIRDGSKAILRWPDAKISNPQIAGYMVFRKTENENFVQLNNSLVQSNYFEDQLPDIQKNYTYTVSTVDDFGNISDPSPVATITPPGKKILPPSLLYTRRLSTGVEISWPEKSSIITTGIYTIYRKTKGGNFIKIGSVGMGQDVFLDKKPVFNQLNIYSVTLSQNNSESEKSIEKSLFVEK